ncbi:MAG: dTDP-4-dehydrorhamnose 3,5-epimerase family protein [Ilumatobacteraceae bacterium]
MESGVESEIAGVVFHPLRSHPDERGVLTEVFRDTWALGDRPVQWNVVRSEPGVLRGVHCHWHHTDILNVVAGELILGIVDLRPGSPTESRAEMHRIPALSAVVGIPPGVAHGFYFEEPTCITYGVSAYWSLDDELGCRWNDPDLGLDWPCTAPSLSERDRTAGPLVTLRAAIASALARHDA